MTYKQTRTYLCIVCKRNEIIESKLVHPFEGAIPDINTCDLNIYSNYKVEGGKLFRARPKAAGVYWKEKEKQKNKAPFGGVCNKCLKEPSLETLVMDALEW